MLGFLPQRCSKHWQADAGQSSKTENDEAPNFDEKKTIFEKVMEKGSENLLHLRFGRKGAANVGNRLESIEKALAQNCGSRFESS